MSHHHCNFRDTANQIIMTTLYKQLPCSEGQAPLRNSYGSEEGKANVTDPVYYLLLVMEVEGIPVD